MKKINSPSFFNFIKKEKFIKARHTYSQEKFISENSGFEKSLEQEGLENLTKDYQIQGIEDAKVKNSTLREKEFKKEASEDISKYTNKTYVNNFSSTQNNSDLVFSFDFNRIPWNSKLIGSAYQKYKPILVRAQNFAYKNKIRVAIDCFEVVENQNIPRELREMIHQNKIDLLKYIKDKMKT